MQAFVGTAGWNIPAQYAEHFPGLGTHLERYAMRLNAVEINSSFYRPHRRQTYERWAGCVPEGFRFAVKVPKVITHEHKLLECEDVLDRFTGEVRGLGGKLGVLLVQLPPSLKFDAAVVDAFFKALKARVDAAIACEPRHATWFGDEAQALLRVHRVAQVAADPAPAPGAGEPGGWPDLVYYRLHGSPRMYYSNYEPERLEAMRRRLTDSATRGADAWCIFDNTAAFAALGNALAVADVL